MREIQCFVTLPLEDIIILKESIAEYEKSKNEIIRLQAEVNSLRIIQRQMMDKLTYALRAVGTEREATTTNAPVVSCVKDKNEKSKR